MIVSSTDIDNRTCPSCGARGQEVGAVTLRALLKGEWVGAVADEKYRFCRSVDCDVLTIGQYLQPSLDDHAPVERYYHPSEFDQLADYARRAGFLSVASGPFVRSSYNAGEVFEESRRRLTARN